MNFPAQRTVSQIPLLKPQFLKSVSLLSHKSVSKNKIKLLTSVQTKHIIKRTNVLMLILYFLHTFCHNSDLIRSILIIFRGVTEHQQSLYKTQMDC